MVLLFSASLYAALGVCAVVAYVCIGLFSDGCFLYKKGGRPFFVKVQEMDPELK